MQHIFHSLHQSYLEHHKNEIYQVIDCTCRHHTVPWDYKFKYLSSNTYQNKWKCVSFLIPSGNKIFKSYQKLNQQLWWVLLPPNYWAHYLLWICLLRSERAPLMVDNPSRFVHFICRPLDIILKLGNCFFFCKDEYCLLYNFSVFCKKWNCFNFIDNSRMKNF